MKFLGLGLSNSIKRRKKKASSVELSGSKTTMGRKGFRSFFSKSAKLSSQQPNATQSVRSFSSPPHPVGSKAARTILREEAVSVTGKNFSTEDIRKTENVNGPTEERNVVKKTDNERSDKVLEPQIPNENARKSSSFVSKGSMPRNSLLRRSGGPKYSRSKRSPKEPAADDPALTEAYDQVPLLEIIKLSRGGVSMETEAVGRIQFGIPPETIKDSMRLGLDVPSIYIVPVERFCREMGPALGVNLAEFEFPAYFNFFVQKKRCTLIVDSDEERNIRRVFSETLLGPAQFRRSENPISYEEEDFAADFPRDAIPDFQKELKHFRIMPDGKELVLETLLNFCHFEGPSENGGHENLGVPPPLDVELQETGEDKSKVDNVPEIVLASQTGTESSTKESDLATIEVKKAKSLAYAQLKLVGEVAVIYPTDATPEQIKNRTCRRAKVLKMPGGTDYVVHDINENNIIIGKIKFAGHVRVSESMSVDGFGGRSSVSTKAKTESDFEYDELKDDIAEEDSVGEEEEGKTTPTSVSVLPPTFHPPSFGVTVLGNSHGFDKSGSVSGYVLWINGRGVMIDPPPYSSFTLEKEGIRPRTIVGIILTHCHADHDAGAFQKVLTGSPVVVITTPTIYKSFIRKYAALSALSPALLRHCHRHKPAIIGAPLRFQGATFHFTYTLHTIPCVGFRVEWRGRSMVFTGDHFNSPPAIDTLQQTGVLSHARAQDLRTLPLQETDLLLHEAGAPPIHTPLDVLLQLPPSVKRRLYVVHTSALPEGCELRVAPTGTAGTIRLDEREPSNASKRNLTIPNSIMEGLPFEDDGNGMFQSMWNSREYDAFGESPPNSRNSSDLSFSIISKGTIEPPRVALRPTSSTDAWFILNLFSAVPFLSSLSYASTMEVLETARVDAFCINDVVVPASRRKEVLCVVWEGTCMERERVSTVSVGNIRRAPTRSDQRRVSTFQVDLGKHQPLTAKDARKKNRSEAVWHAGDWTGPRSLQPEKRLSGESSLSETHDIVAMCQEGVKVITVEFTNLHKILKSGSSLYRKYLSRKAKITNPDMTPQCLEGTSTGHLFEDRIRNLNVIEILECNSALRKLSAVQKRHLESLAEGPAYYAPGQRLWRSGATVDKAFIVVAGTASFVPKRRNAGSVGLGRTSKDNLNGHLDVRIENESSNSVPSLGEMMRQDAAKVCAELGTDDGNSSSNSSISSNASDSKEGIKLESGYHQPSSESVGTDSLADNHDYAKLSRGLQRRADSVSASAHGRPGRRDSSSTEMSHDGTYNHDYCGSLQNAEDENDDENEFSLDYPETEGGIAQTTEMLRRRSSRDRFANKVLGRLFSRRAFTAGLVFSKGHFLGDVSKMVAGSLSSTYRGESHFHGDDSSAKYGFGEKPEGDPNSRDGPVG